jgi:predicted transcriptional regulator
MTVRLSPHKVSKILRGYFSGLPQTKIAKAAGVDQSSISHYASRFKSRAAGIGILAAGRGYQVLNEVESLRSLSVELYKSKLTTEEAKQGHNIIRAFQKLGVSPEKHLLLVEVCKRVGEPSFVEKALELARIEGRFGMSRDQAVSSFEEAVKQLPQFEAKISKAKSELKTTNNAILKKKRELSEKEEYVRNYQGKVKVQVAQLEKEASSEMDRFNVQKKEIEAVANLREELSKQGLDLQTLLQLGKEFSHGNIKG